jgi:hypothetical protein
MTNVSAQFAVQVGTVHGGLHLRAVEPEEFAGLDKLRAKVASARKVRVRWGRVPRTVRRTESCQFVGRDGELARLRELLLAGHHVYVHGPSGVGKSAFLEHAAAVGVLRADTVNDCAGMVWIDRPTTAAKTIHHLLITCCGEVAAAARSEQARDLLSRKRLLVVLDQVRMSAKALSTVIEASPGSVFVIASQRRDLWETGVSLPLGPLPVQDCVRLLEARLGERLGTQDVQRVEQIWESYAGLPRNFAQLGELLDHARVQGTISGLPEELVELRMVVPRLVAGLSEPTAFTLRILAAFAETQWSPDLLIAAAGVATARHPDVLVRVKLAEHHSGEYSVSKKVAGEIAALSAEEMRCVVERITIWVAGKTRPEQVVAGIDVIERALRVALDNEEYLTALALARAAIAKLIRHIWWGPWDEILTLGLRAAVGAGSSRDQAYFHYALATRRLLDGKHTDAVELLIAAIGSCQNTDDQDIAQRAAALRAEIRHFGSADSPAASAEPAEQLTGNQGTFARGPLSVVNATVQAGRQAARDMWTAITTRLLKTPAVAQTMQFVQANPMIIRAVGTVAALAAIMSVLTASGHTNQATAQSPPPPTVSGTRLSPSDPAAPAIPTTVGTTPGQSQGPTTTTGQPGKAVPASGVTDRPAASGGQASLPPPASPDDPLPCAAVPLAAGGTSPPNLAAPQPAHQTTVPPGATPINIDARQTEYGYFIVPGIVSDWIDARIAQTLRMAPGTYPFQIQGGSYADFTFNVTSAGTISYDAKYRTFLAGEGTTTLTVVGLPITLDARRLSSIGVILTQMPPTKSGWIRQHQIRLVPESYYQVQQGSGEVSPFTFKVGLDGNITYAADLDVSKGGFLRGNNTTTLEFVPYPICVDTRAAGGIGVILQPIWGMPFSYTHTTLAYLLPDQWFQIQVDSGIVTKAAFTLDLHGTFSFDPSLTPYLRLTTSHGIPLLTALGPLPT